VTEDQGIIIVGPDGTEHEFPAGMDPKKAAAIVRGQVQPAKYEPDSPLLHHLNEQEGPAQAPDWKSKLGNALQPLAHPQSGADMSALMIPGEAGARIMGKIIEPAAAAAGKYGGAALDIGKSFLPQSAQKAVGVLRQLNPSTWNSPLTAAGREGRAYAGIADQVDRYLPNSGGMPTSATITPNGGRIPYAEPTPIATPKAAYSASDVTKLKALVGQGVPQELALKILQQSKQGVTAIP